MKFIRWLLISIPLIAIGYTLMHADVGSELLNAVTNDNEPATRRILTNELTNRELERDPYVLKSLATAIDKHNVRIVKLLLEIRGEDFQENNVRDALKKAQCMYGNDDPIVQILLQRLSKMHVIGMY